MDEKGNKFYWLKLKRDFFKRHDIRVIESMPNGKDYILFYLKLLCESVDHDGGLRFSENIPYNESMLATVTDANVDVVRSAIKIFSDLEMMEIMDDGTYYMREVSRLIGGAADNDNANRQRRFRERKKQEALCDCYDSVTKNNESKSKSKSKKIPPIAPQGGDDDRFNRFWAAYPKRVGKTAARKAFAKIKPDDQMMDVILEAVEFQGNSDQWKRDGGQYIPNPATWLNQGRWEDELTIPNQGEQLPQRNFLN